MEEEKQLSTRQNKKINWRIKALLSILVSVIAIVIILFGITYVYFEKKLEDNTKKVAEATFRQADKELKKMLSTVEGEVNRYGSLTLPLEYLRDDYKNDVDKSVVSMQIIKELDGMMLLDPNISAISLIKSDGSFIFSTSDRSRSGKTTISGSLKETLKKAEEKYPYMIWVSNYETQENGEKAFSLIANKPSFIGIKYLGKGSGGEKDVFIIATVNEKSVRKTYESVVYNGSIALLVNDDGIVISETGEALLGKKFERKAGFQTIEHELKNFDWKLYNLVPKEGYLKDTKDIRRFGTVVGFISCILILIAGLIWSRRYTRPIQYLMDQMKLVQEENFDIKQPGHQGWEELDTLNYEFYLLVVKLRKYISDIKAVERENMMNIRYGNTMEYKVICDGSLLKEDFPRMILQPMIENCFIYGSDPLDKRVITVNIRKEEMMKVSISNSGVNMDRSKLDSLNDMLRNNTGNSEHIGLSNAKKRLDILYKDTGNIWLEQDDKGTLTVEIRF